jgi:hypothetical protein
MERREGKISFLMTNGIMGWTEKWAKICVLLFDFGPMTAHCLRLQTDATVSRHWASYRRAVVGSSNFFKQICFAFSLSHCSGSHPVGVQKMLLLPPKKYCWCKIFFFD